MDTELNELYQTIYPDRTLKDLQINIISKLLKGKDVVAILATGYGKSICYQLPYLYFKNKNVIVVSPLIALMEDQQINLEKIGIPSICFNSTMSLEQKDIERKKLTDTDESKIIYITPETLLKEKRFIRELIRCDKLALFAIDEAHCISAWGHEFRKDYQDLSCLKEWLNELSKDDECYYSVPIFACTATATHKVQLEMIKFLQLEKPIIVKSSFDRTNLFIACKKKRDILMDLYPYLEEYKNDYIIIYAKTRDDTEKICGIVQELNIPCEAYHGGLTPKKRKEIHRGFVNGTYRCIVATIAFGMGIDQNIHLIIHYGLPNDIESYIQEIGRAGRDGKDSKCILFWNIRDIQVGRLLLKDIQNEIYKKFREQQLNLMEKWTHANCCRRIILLKHFGESFNGKCNKCDNCLILKEQDKFNQEPIYWLIFLILKTFYTSKSSGIGSKKIIDIIRGSKSKYIENFYKTFVYGKGIKYNQFLIKDTIRMLIFNEYLNEQSIQNKYGSMIVASEKTLELWSLIKDFKSENDMNYIKWPEFDIPTSFNTILDFLKKNNGFQDKLERRTDLQKTLDLFDLDSNGSPLDINININKENLTKEYNNKKKSIINNIKKLSKNIDEQIKDINFIENSIEI